MEFSFCEKHTKKEPQLLYLLKFLSFVWGDDVPLSWGASVHSII